MRTPVIILIVILLIILAALGGFFAAQQLAPSEQVEVTVAGGEGISSADVQATVDARLTEIADDTDAERTPAVTQELVAVYVARVEIPRGVVVRPDMVELVEAPIQYVPLRALDDPEQVIGKIARTDIEREQVILSSLLVENLSELAAGGSDAAAILEPGRVAIALPIDAITSVAYALQPGDRVDVIVSMLFVDVDIDFQSLQPNEFRPLSIELQTDEEGATGITYTLEEGAVGDFSTRSFTYQIPGNPTSQLTIPVLDVPSEDQRPRLVTQRTVQDAVVVYLGEFPSDGRIFREEPVQEGFTAFEATHIGEGQLLDAPNGNTTVPMFDGEEITVINQSEDGNWYQIIDSTGAEGWVPVASVNTGTEGAPGSTPAPARDQIVTLAVRPQDAVVLSYIAEAGLPMTFALRSARDTELPLTEAVNLDYIMRTYGILVPDRLQYAVEPAIRSIRELSLGERIELNQQTPTPEPNGSSEEGSN